MYSGAVLWNNLSRELRTRNQTLPSRCEHACWKNYLNGFNFIQHFLYQSKCWIDVEWQLKCWMQVEGNVETVKGLNN